MTRILRGVKVIALYLLITLFSVCSLLPAPALAQEVMLDIDKPFTGKIRLTWPDFQKMKPGMTSTQSYDYPLDPATFIGNDISTCKTVVGDCNPAEEICYTDQPWEGTICTNATNPNSQDDYSEAPAAIEGAPNILTIVLDDTGFAGLGSYGGRIETPNMDHLAYNGLRYNNFHVAPLCAPTRAALLTGCNPHTVGMAGIPEMSNGYPNKTGSIPLSAATLPTVLKPYGYANFALGKWHMTPTWAMTPATGHFDQWPTGKGFDHFYGFLGGETNQYYPELYRDTSRVEQPKSPEEGYHLSEDLVDNAINYIKDLSSTDPERPYFMYLSFGAVHAPHQTPEFYRDMYKYKFDDGYDVERDTILANQIDMGIVPEDTDISPHNEQNPYWSGLDDDRKDLFTTFMENYAGFMTHTDAQIGRLVDYLDSIDELDNTLIMVVSDNGASAEGSENGTLNEMTYFNGIPTDLDYNEEHEEDIGTIRSEPHIPWGWSLASNTPFQGAKHFAHEGGIHTPFIVHWPEYISDPGAVRPQWQYVTDIVPTVLDILDRLNPDVNIEMPDTVNDVKQQPIAGKSFLDSLTNSKLTSHRVQYWEDRGNRSVYQDGWKAVAEHKDLLGKVVGTKGDFQSDTWELYYLPADFSEAYDLITTDSDDLPEEIKEQLPEGFDPTVKLAQMQVLFDEQALQHNVYPLDDRESYELIADKNEALGGEKTDFTFYQGMSPLHQDLAPNTFGTSYTIDVYVDRKNADSEGVLVAQGGTAGGYTLYLKDNKLVYEYNSLGLERFNIYTDTPFPLGQSTVTYKFTNTGSNQDGGYYYGTGELYINDDLVGTASIDETVPSTFGVEFFDVGQDSQSPVSETYKPPFKFNDLIDKVTVHIETDESV